MTHWIDDLAEDVRYAVRRLVRDRAFTATAMATLALGVGAATGVFSLVSAVVFRPLPFAQPDRLVQMYGTPVLRGEAVDNLDDYRSQSTSFDALVGYGISARYLRTPAGSELVTTVTAERNLFSMLGVNPLIGRPFQPDDSSTVAVVAEGFWRRRLAANPSVLGTTLTLDGTPLTIVGVMGESFQFPYRAGSILSGVASESRTDLWIPFDPPPRDAAARGRFAYVTGRLKLNVSIRTAEEELAVIARRREERTPDRYGPRGVRLAPLSAAVVGPSVRQALFLLLAAVGLVLALACANLANLALARLTLRRREIAIRLAIGATRARVMRQWLVDGLLLSLASGSAGLVVASWVAKWLLLLAGPQLPRAHEVHLDWRVMLFLLGTCFATAAALAVAPLFAGSDRDGRPDRQEISQRRLRNALVVLETVVAFVLAVGALVVIRELVRLRNTDLGMVTRNVLTVHVGERIVSRGRERPFATDVAQFYEIADRIQQFPDVRAAGFIQALPLQNWGWRATSIDFRVRGRPPGESPAFQFELRYVTPGYFRALGIPILRGRPLTVQDDRTAPGVILINEAFARRYFPAEDPIGLETTRGTIVGIVGDVRQEDIQQPASPEMYYPIAQNWAQVSELGMTLVANTGDRPEQSIDRVRSVIRQVNPNLAVFSVKTMDQVIRDWLSGFTLFLWLIAAFAAIALLLAAGGTYGVISYVTAARTREVAIRMALGADRSQVMRWVWSQGIRLTIAGLGIGAALVVSGRPLLSRLAIRTSPPDMTTIVPAAFAVLVLALAACQAPARRAAAVDPASALRDE